MTLVNSLAFPKLYSIDGLGLTSDGASSVSLTSEFLALLGLQDAGGGIPLRSD